MKVYKTADFVVSGIDFCCKQMAEELLVGKITTIHWADHPLRFRINGYPIAHCPHCGARIETEHRPIDD